MRMPRIGPSGRAAKVNTMRMQISLACLLGVGLSLVGCLGQSAVPTSTELEPPDAALVTVGPAELVLTHVLVADAEYYLDGPQQARPPDGTLSAGTEVGLVSEAGSYSLVRTGDGLEAYVATGSLKPLDQ